MSNATKRLQTFLDTLNHVDHPSEATYMLGRDSPEREYFNADSSGLETEVKVVYRDETLGVVLRPTYPDNRVWVFLSDPFHEVGIVGVPKDIPPRDRPPVWTREAIAEMLKTDALGPVAERDGPVQRMQSKQRLQGRVCCFRYRRGYADHISDFKQINDHPVPFVYKEQGKRLEVADQTITVEEAGMANIRDENPRTRLEDPEMKVLLHIPEGTIVAMKGPNHSRRTVTVAGGYYEFRDLGDSMDAFASPDERVQTGT